MRAFSTATASYLAQARAGGFVARLLFWVAARNRTTGEVETIGIWNGRRDRAFTIGGATRTYKGAGGLLSVDPIVYIKGLGVQMQRARLSPIDEEVELLIRGYDARLAPVEIHRALFDPQSRALVDEPHRVFRGRIDKAPVTVPELGGEMSVEITMASSARDLTRTLALRKSDEAQQLRSGDRFLRYADISGQVQTWWGEAGPGGAFSLRVSQRPVREPRSGGDRG
ncbi:MAG: hypothetical protein ACK4GW_13245 [Pseudorhodobacter sp.]